MGIAWLALWALLLPTAGWAEVQVYAQVSPSSVGVGEALSYSVNVSGGGADTPELGQLDQLEIAGSGTRSVFRSVNGKITREQVFTYTLVPQQAGPLTIPPTRVEVGGKTYWTEALSVTVQKASNRSRAQAPRGSSGAFGGMFPLARGVGEGDVTIHTSVDRDNPYVGEQVILTFSFDRAVDLSGSPGYTPATVTGFRSFDLTFPAGQDVYARTEAGRRHIVQERKHALFAVRPGELTIGPASLRFSVDPFSGGQQLMTEPITLTARPLPSADQPADFSGAVGEFALNAKLDRDTARVGDAVSLTVTVSGSGNFHDISGAKIADNDGFEVYAPELSEQLNYGPDGVRGARVFEYILIPNTAGVQQVGPVSLSWFNPQTEHYQSAQAGPFTVTVKPGAAAPGVAASPVSSDIPNIRSEVTPPKLGLPWWGFLEILAVVAVAGGLLWRLMRRQPQLATATTAPSSPSPAPVVPPKNGPREALTALDAAREMADSTVFLKAVESAMTRYLAWCWGVSATRVDGAYARQRLSDSPEVREPCVRLFDLLARARFAPGGLSTVDREGVLSLGREVVGAVAAPRKASDG